MGSVAISEARWDWPGGAPADTGANGFLNHIRFVALGCRAKARADLFKACALLATDRSQSIKAHAEALMLCMNEALDRRAVLFRPGIAEMSFDEAWLVRLATALKQGDEMSVQFLLHSRVTPAHRRHVRFLVSRIAGQFAQL